jgi:hypothetical protein
MGPMPRHLLERKLITAYFKNFLYREPIIPEDFNEALFKCWEKFGVNDKRCDDEVLKLDWAYDTKVNYRKSLKSMKLQHLVNGTLPNPVYHKEVKGRGRYLRFEGRKEDLRKGVLDKEFD